MIFLWGSPEDGPLAAVRQALSARGADVLQLDQPDLLHSRFVQWDVECVLQIAGDNYPLAGVTASYPRPYLSTPTGIATHPSARRHLARVEQRLWEWATTTPSTMVNRPSPGATNATKTTQTRLAMSCGFDVPPSLVTTDADALLDFADRWGPVICKGAGGARTIVSLFDVADMARLNKLTTCPAYFQAYRPGLNHRVHVVGERIFAVAVSSAQVDYRYGGCTMAPVLLPDDIADKCRSVCSTLGLMLAGIDLIHGDDGRWYFLEANTSPAFTYFDGCEQVASAIAELLITA